MPDKRTIWKYPILVSQGAVTQRMPKGALIVAVGMDPTSPAADHVVAVWADVTIPQAGQPGFTEERDLLVTGTGHPVPEHATYLGLALEPGFAWHVWETC